MHPCSVSNFVCVPECQLTFQRTSHISLTYINRNNIRRNNNSRCSYQRSKEVPPLTTLVQPERKLDRNISNEDVGRDKGAKEGLKSSFLYGLSVCVQFV